VWGEAIEAEGEPPPVGESATEMVGTMNRMVRNDRDHGQEKPEAEGPVHKEDFLRMWSSVWYSNHTAEKQKAFDLIYKGVDRLIADATPSDAAELGGDKKFTWEQTLMP
jgi:hypothetical protein